ncbi:MAG: ABC transporter permease [Candidatus Hodarchaeales archaeon]
MVAVSEWAVFQFRHIIRRNFWVYRKYLLNRLLWNLVTPTITLLAFGIGVGSYITEGINGINYITFLAPGLISFSTALAASADCTWGAFLRMKFQDTYDAQLATPLSARDLILGEVIYASIAAEIASIAMLFIAFVLNAPLSPLAIVVPLIVFSGAITFASLGILATSYAPKIEYFTYFFDGFLLPIQFLSGAFFPIEILPEPLFYLAHFIPLTPVVTNSRNAFLGIVNWMDIIWMVVLCASVSLIALSLARRKLVKRLLM